MDCLESKFQQEQTFDLYSPSRKKSDGQDYLQSDATTQFCDQESIQIPLEQRITNYNEIYNEQMSPTIVYIAYDTQKQRKVIVKKIVKSKLNQQMHMQAKSELEISIKLKHFNIVQSYETHQTDTDYIIVQEFLDEADFFTQKIIQQRKPIKNADKLQVYLYDILIGLKFLHENKIVHLDIKPHNLYCCDGKAKGYRRVKIGDFGLSRILDEKGEAKIQEMCGTFGFKAPEVQNDSVVTEKADIWSLGITIYYMVCAYLPHHVKGYKYGEGEITFRPLDWKKKPQLKELVQNMLEIEPEKRPSAKECIDHAYFFENLPTLRKRSSQFNNF